MPQTDHIPPTEAELREWHSRAERYDIAPDNYRRLITEIRRLRELCERAEPFVRASAGLIPPLQTSVEWHRFADELRAASKGEV